MTKIQDRAEERTLQYLQHLGHLDIESQPEGRRRFPDFRLEKRIGVEVTILDRRLEIDGKLTNAPDSSKMLRNFFELLPNFGPPIRGVSWFVRPQFKRPFVSWDRLKPAVEGMLRAFQANPQGAAIVDIEVLPGKFWLTLIRAGNRHSECFLNGAHDDEDFGGYMMEYELKRNIELCIRQKTRKRSTAELKQTYSEWWLVLYDQISRESSHPDFSGDMRIEHDWDKVILLDFQHPAIAYEL